ncbi:MAG: hypothetical protein IJU39_05055 [Clostridia bacterium]|nr:hypothetical protein [Clostridia bacterium]
MRGLFEKLGLTQSQYSVLGALMMILSVLLSVEAFLVADYSLSTCIAIALVAIESGLIGYCFRRIAGDLSTCDDPKKLEEHKISDKSRKNAASICAFIALMVVVCVVGAVLSANPQDGLETAAEVTAQALPQETVSAEASVSAGGEEIDENYCVYATPSGKRYHFSPQCAGDTCFAITIEEALAHSLTPCQKCVSS